MPADELNSTVVEAGPTPRSLIQLSLKIVRFPIFLTDRDGPNMRHCGGEVFTKDCLFAGNGS